MWEHLMSLCPLFEVSQIEIGKITDLKVKAIGNDRKELN
jgi:hypothetical protein